MIVKPWFEALHCTWTEGAVGVERRGDGVGHVGDPREAVLLLAQAGVVLGAVGGHHVVAQHRPAPCSAPRHAPLALLGALLLVARLVEGELLGVLGLLGLDAEAGVEAVAGLCARLVVALHRQRPQRLLVVRLAGVGGVAGGAGRVDAAMASVVM